MLIAALLVAGAQAAAPGGAAPGPATIALGERLARTGVLATLLPRQAAKETDELVAAHPELSPADQAALRRTARATADAAMARVLAVEGRRYAELLSAADLQALVAQAESPAAQHWRAAQPQVIAGVMTALAGMNFKRDVTARFCRETGKACPAK